MRFAFFFILFFTQCAWFTREPGRPPRIDGVAVADSLRSVYVQNIRNNSYGAAIHTRLTALLKSEIDRRGRFLQTRNKDEAKYRIYGEIIHYQITGNLVDTSYNHVSSEMSIVVKIEVQKAGAGSIELERDEIPVRIVFSGQIGIRENERTAQDRALRILAVRIAEEAERAWYYSLLKK